MTALVLGTIVAQSGVNWTSIAGMAFDGFRIHNMHFSGWHSVLNRRNFAAGWVANMILGVEVQPPIGTARGLAFDGKQFWTITRDPAPNELLCYKLEDGIFGVAATYPRVIKSFPLTAAVSYSGVCFDGKHLIATGGNRIEFWNPQTEVMDDWFAPGFAAYDLTFDGKYLWVCAGFNNFIYCVNPVSRTVVTSFAFPPAPDSWPMGIACDGFRLWIGSYPNGMGTIYCVEKS